MNSHNLKINNLIEGEVHIIITTLQWAWLVLLHCIAGIIGT